MIGTARCCRDWPVYLNEKLIRCGLCGKVPVIVSYDYPAPDAS